MRDRNHEGYHDPTACGAIRRADKRKRRGRKRPAFALRLSEAPGFKEAKRAMAGQGRDQ